MSSSPNKASCNTSVETFFQKDTACTRKPRIQWVVRSQSSECNQGHRNWLFHSVCRWSNTNTRMHPRVIAAKCLLSYIGSSYSLMGQRSLSIAHALLETSRAHRLQMRNCVPQVRRSKLQQLPKSVCWYFHFRVVVIGYDGSFVSLSSVRTRMCEVLMNFGGIMYREESSKWECCNG